ncbi:MAG: hypothetical protein B1H13_00330 [Desulfobacteraceae bacterium 4484_190.3]|nr:MAG: hypothetical protein B1H13_00330 [Desulfobacteraceae bacterium 4484_190.3]
MIIREALSLTLLGMGIVFLVLAIDFASILVIGIFRKQEQTDSGVESQDLEPEPEDGEKTGISAQPIEVEGESGGVPGQEVAAIMAAICTWEAGKGGEAAAGFASTH